MKDLQFFYWFDVLRATLLTPHPPPSVVPLPPLGKAHFGALRANVKNRENSKFKAQGIKGEGAYTDVSNRAFISFATQKKTPNLYSGSWFRGILGFFILRVSS